MRDATPVPSPSAPARLLAGPAGAALGVLTLVNLLNYLDRFLVAALVKDLKADLALSDTQVGWLAPAFTIVYMLAAPLFGPMGDRGRRPRLIAAGVFLWSLATGLGGLARSFLSLFLARALVGVGEAAYGTISPGLLADLYPRALRGRVMAVFFAAIPVGSALAYMVGGLARSAFGWRGAFFVAGAPGLLLALVCLRLADPPRGARDEAPAPAERQGARAAYRDLARNRLYLLTVLGYAAYTFAIGGLALWMPTFLQRVRGLTQDDANVSFGVIVVVTGFVGTFAGGWLGDRLQRRARQGYLWLSGVAALLAAPLAWLVFTDPRPAVYLGAAAAAQLLLFASTGPINTVIVNVVRPQERATAVALSILAIHVLGDVPSPPLIGWLSDHGGLGRAVLIMPAAVLACGAIWTWAAWRGRAAPS